MAYVGSYNHALPIKFKRLRARCSIYEGEMYYTMQCVTTYELLSFKVILVVKGKIIQMQVSTTKNPFFYTFNVEKV